MEYEDEKKFDVKLVADEKSLGIKEYTYYKQDKPIVNIPPVLSNLLVTEISENAFAALYFFKLTMPDTIVSIAGWAFSDNNITDVVISKKVREIGASTFAVNNITNLIIPTAVKKIGYRHFMKTR